MVVIEARGEVRWIIGSKEEQLNIRHHRKVAHD